MISLSLGASNGGIIGLTVYWTENTSERKGACLPKRVAIVATTVGSGHKKQKQA